MGELLLVKDIAGELRTLNGLFNATNYANTKANIKELRDIHGPFLKGPPNDLAGERKRHKRERSLRFAASILTDDIAFTKNSNKDPSRGRLAKWLRWLTWLEKQQNDGTNCTDLNGGHAAGFTPHDLITQTLETALKDQTTGAIFFDFTHSGAGLAVTVSKDNQNPTTYSIVVTGLDAEDTDVKNTPTDADDDYDPDP